ncbi:MAG TPA: putative sulfate exporter family transporter [Longimicrobiales bacterium]|nr:putative sulfate exporter family transporter [Longimicrobiales bacterium]
MDRADAGRGTGTDAGTASRGVGAGVFAGGARGAWLRRAAFLALLVFMATPWATPALALGLGAALALTAGNPFAARTARASKWLLQASVVGLGFGMPLSAVVRAGAAGVGYTVAGIATALVLGLLLGRWLEVEEQTSLLLTAGTSICGGSAIAAVGPAIGARSESMSVALATVFVLNAVALYAFPAIGHLLGLSQGQFAVWAAVAIHDTSSVVGAASSYGAEALQSATVLKLARALWIVPLTLAAAAYARRRARPPAGAGAARVKLPWFIGLFVAAALLRTLLPSPALPALDVLAHVARVGLVVTLFLIGAGLSRSTLKDVGPRPLVQGLLLWLAVASLALLAVRRWVPA